MRVAAYLKIPFREIDLSTEYNEDVVTDMIASYQNGTTPNPDVRCNEKIKFGHFLRYALSAGADYVATGHYARVEQREHAHRLLRGKDANKDQSYFLYKLSQHELSHALFPIGELQKTEVRRLAKELGLPVAQKPDSQGLCFVGAVSIPEFLSRYISLVRGPVIDTIGNTIGDHDGAALFTIGQRHGFRTSTAPAHPLYVVDVDIAHNTITVSPETTTASRAYVDVAHMHWISGSESIGTVLAQSRYREEPARARVEGARIHFVRPHVVTPGQSLVLYDTDVCLGGGIIRNIHTHE